MYNDYTALLNVVLYKPYNNIQIYPLQCGPIHMGKFLKIVDVPQNGSVSESLTHTSGHRFKICKVPGRYRFVQQLLPTPW